MCIVGLVLVIAVEDVRPVEIGSKKAGVGNRQHAFVYHKTSLANGRVLWHVGQAGKFILCKVQRYIAAHGNGVGRLPVKHAFVIAFYLLIETFFIAAA